MVRDIQQHLAKIRLALACALLVGAAGCAYTSEFKPDAAASAATALIAKNPGEIMITEGEVTDKRYVVLGTATATVRRTSWLFTGNPTREDANEELRAKAAALGADAVMRVHYHSGAQGLMSRGVMVAEGVVITYK